MHRAKEFGVWIFVWVIGCIVFDALLCLRGAWLMGGGAITYVMCELAVGSMRANGPLQGRGFAESPASGGSAAD